MTLHRATPWVVLLTAAATVSYTLVAMRLEGSAATVSAAMEAAGTWPAVPLMWGALGGHFFGRALRPRWASDGAALVTMVAALVAVTVMDVAISVPPWAPFPLLLAGCALGLTWPTGRPR